ncbi:MAG: N-acetylmuramic acid 6-phosphate etherase [Candidatus Marinimicrobia bacterium CG08_land_8_20_14_0_20_45_22]|nr:MAG: N-acetylmuramic acid 6-phosphate etherase [Candidatus Marinimicrobia bacterium CG08_land_8_20_14_0_20_45_22]
MQKILNRSEILTEKINPKSEMIDTFSTEQIIRLINEEDGTVYLAVQKAIPQIVQATEIVSKAFKTGGRLRYIGAGTSGRLGVLDASECPPSFSVPIDLVQGMIAGGWIALRQAVEGAEDFTENGVEDCKANGLQPTDVLMGIATGGTTPYVHGAIQYARSIGCKTIFFTCTPKEGLGVVADVIIEVLVGPELITGSTRLKAGTATKMVLNMITTTAMIKTGKVYGNYMIDHQAINSKLVDRGTRIISELTGLSYQDAYDALMKADKHVKEAVVMVKKGISLEEARRLIREHDGFVRFAFE